MVNNRELAKDIIELIGLLLIGGFLVGALPNLALTVGKGIEDRDLFDKGNFYGTLGLASLFLMVALSVGKIFVKTGVLPEERFGWFRSYVHDPENGVFAEMGWRFIESPFQLWFLSIIVFGWITLVFGAVFATSFVGVPPTVFQVEEGARIIFGMEPAATAETLAALFPLSLLAGILAFIFLIKLDVPVVAYLLVTVVLVSPLMGLAWMTWHNAAYPADEAARLNVFAFGFVGSAVTLTTGSALPWWVWHQENNFVAKALEQFGNEVVIYYGVIILLVLTFMFIAYKVGETFFFSKRDLPEPLA